MSEVAARIAAAAGDANALLALAIELAQENARLAAEAAVLERRRATDANRKRRQRHGESDESRDVTGQDVTVRDIAATVPPSPSPSFPTPHITPSSPPSAATAAASEPPVVFDAVDALLSRIPEDSRPAWRAEIAVAEQAMHGPAMTAEQIQRACRDYLGNRNLARAEPSMRHFRAYLRDAARPPREHRPTATKPSDYDADAAWAEILELLPLWQRREPDIATRQQALPKETRRGLSAIGGFRVIAETPDHKRVWLKQDFAKAFEKAPLTTATTP